MNETEIQAQLKQRMVQPEPSILAPQQEPDTTVGQATIAPAYELDEMLQFKLHDLFGAQYESNDEVTRQQLTFIYQEISSMIPEQEYGFIAAKINDLMRIIGISHSENKIYRLYQWLRLNKVRLSTEAEMGALSG